MKAVYAPEATNDFLIAAVGSPLFWVLAWLLIINLVTFFLFGIDKLKAKRKEKKETIRRIPEKTLFLCSALGGSIGALLGMKAWHHKTLHKSFRFGIPAILAAQIIIPLGLYIYFTTLR